MSDQLTGETAAPGTEVAVPDPDGTVEPPAEQQPATVEAPAAEVDSKVIYASITDAGERKPIIPVPLQRENIRATVRQFAGLNAHRAGYHGLRWPWYLIAVAFWAVVGVVRLVIRQIWWAWLLEAHPLKTDAVLGGESKEYRSLHAMQVKWRARTFTVLGVEAVAALVLSLYLTFGAPWQVQAAAAATAAILAARFGRPAGHRIIAPAVVPPRYSEPTHDVISVALGALGISAINAVVKEGGRGIQFITPVYRDGPGWGCQLDLPHGVTAGDIMSRRPSLASGLRRPLSATWPEGVPAEHAGRLALWVGFQDISKAKPPKHPLLKSGTTDIFQPVPFATDPRQRPVAISLFEMNYLFGASPGQGKTAAVRNIAVAAALDPICDLWIHELAGKGDLEPFAQVCHRYVSGLDDEAVEYAADSARMLRAELERRSALFKRLPREVKPDGKLTRDLALKHFSLRPIVAIFDEAQVAFLHQEFGAPTAADLAHVMRLARAYGLIIVIATQRPDKFSVPTAITGVVTGRFCLKVPDYVGNDLVLGTGSYKAGYDSVIFRPKIDAGLGWLKADGEPQIVRTYYLDLNVSEKIAARARVMRERAGVLSGYALGDQEEQAAPRDVLADLLEVFGGDAGLQWADAASRLAERFPDRWADLTAEALSAQCRSLGVRSVDVRMDGSVLKGCRRVAVESAASQ